MCRVSSVQFVGKLQLCWKSSRQIQPIVAETAGVPATAAFLQDAPAHAGQNVVLLMTGANVALEVLRRAVS